MTTDTGIASGSKRELRYRLRQQSLIAQFGLIIARGEDSLDDLLQEAARIAADGLEARFSKVLQFRPEDERFLVRAGVGWKEGTVGTATIGANMSSPAGYALHTGRPVIANHLTRESRFRTPALLREHGVKRAINVMITGGNHPYGVLEADSPHDGKFDSHDTSFLQATANLLAVAIGRLDAEQALRESLEEQKLLLSELNHRVKNNLQVVASLLALEARRVTDQKARERFQSVGRRIDVLSRVHGQLYQSGRSKEINFGWYLRDLGASLAEFHGLEAGSVNLETDAQDLPMDFERAVPLALIANELVTNALKHAFPAGGSGLVRITLRPDGGERATLTVTDNGRAAAAEATNDGGIGRQLVSALVAQIDGEMRIDRTAGTAVTISFSRN